MRRYRTAGKEQTGSKETAQKQYEIPLEGTLKLKVNRDKSRTVSVLSIRNFKYLGFCFGESGRGIHIRVHVKAWKKAKDKLCQLTSRSRCRSIIRTMEKIKTDKLGAFMI